MPITVNGTPLKIEAIISLLQKNDVLNAVKWTREQTGIGLKGAHEIVSNLAKNANYYEHIDYTISNNNAANSKIESHTGEILLNEIKIDGHTFDGTILIPLIQEGEKIAAIKYVNKITNLGLKESKDIIEQLSDTNDSILFPSFDLPNKKESKNTLNQKERKHQTQSKKGSHFIKERSVNSKKIIITALTIGVLIYAYYHFNNVN